MTDIYGRPSQTSVSDGTAYPITRGYDGFGRLRSITYPSGQVAGYTYNAQNYLSGIINGVGGAAFWTANQRDAYLHVTQETYGNGVVANVGYDQVMGRLTSVQVGAGGSIRNLGYVWDLAGRLQSRSDSTFGVTESFGYDLLNRLTSSQIAGGATKTIGYDAVGDITSKSDVGTYFYPASGTGSVRPHAVSSIMGTINTGSGLAVNPVYSYDANGRMLSGGVTGNQRTFTYAGFDAPQSIANSASFVSFTFDPDHQRSKQVATEGTTVYVGTAGVLAEKFTSSTAVTWRDYILADGERVAMVTSGGSGGAPSSTVYFHQDHLGSVIALTGSGGSVVEQDAYDPWGKRRNTNGTDDPYDTLTSLTTRGYTDQEHLADSALIHMNARVYDPQIAKFGSPDPKTSEPFTTQGWDRYAYVANNPLNSTDPSGESGLVVSLQWIYPCLCMPDLRDPVGGVAGAPSQSASLSVGLGGASAGIGQGGPITNVGSSAQTGSAVPSTDQPQESNNGPPPGFDVIVVRGERHPLLQRASVVTGNPLMPPLVTGSTEGFRSWASPRNWPYPIRKVLDWPRKQPEDYLKSDNGSDDAASNSPASGPDTNRQAQPSPKTSSPAAAPPDGPDNGPNRGDLKEATQRDLQKAAKQDGYERVEDWKTQELQLNSRDQIFKDKDGNLYSLPRQGGGEPQPLNVQVP